MNRKLVAAPAIMGVLASVLAACGGAEGGSGGKAIVVGTTDTIELTKETPAPLDPAASYDSATWNVFYNTFQMLLRYPRNSTSPVPDAADTCGFTDHVGRTYRCTLHKDLSFSNGDPLTSKDVMFSVDRMLKINSKTGPSSLLGGVGSVDAPDAGTVVFHLKAPDATFPLKLATPAAAIVDSRVYPRDKPLEGLRITGSGPYTLDSFKPRDKAVFSSNPHYKGSLQLNNSKIELRLFSDSDAMEKALESGDVDVMARSVRPDQIAKLQEGTVKGVTLTEAPGTSTRYLIFNTADASVQQKAVRQAIAQTVDRAQLTRNVFERTAEPLYSPVPQGITGHVNSFFNVYGDPNTAAARKTLRDAGLSAPVPLTYAYPQDPNAVTTKREAEELKRELEAGGLFSVTLQKVPRAAFFNNAIDGKYAIYGITWLPDFPDADNYIAPFFEKNNFLKLAYNNGVIQDQVIPLTRQESQRSAASTEFATAQKIIADDVPMLPLWQGKQYIAARDGITGVEWALNSSSTTQFWELGRGVSG